MGNKNSGNYRVLDEEDINDPLFKELHLVIIGCHGSGKNDIGNAILRKKKFTFWTSFEKHYVKEERTVFGTKVTIVRTPGWSGELSLCREQRELRQEIKDAVSSFENGPHAILLAIKVNSTPTDTTEKTLEKLLTRRFWNHTIIRFKGDLQKANSEDKKNIQSLIEIVKSRIFVLQKPIGFDESKKINEDIALMIAENDVPLHFSVTESEKYDESLERNRILECVRRRIKKLNKELDTNAATKRTEIKKNLKRLQKILAMYEGLGTDSAQPDQSTQSETRNTKEEEQEESLTEINHSEASKLLSTKMTFGNGAGNGIELIGTLKCQPHVSTFGEADFCSWKDSLVKLLEELNEEQFKKFKNKIYSMKFDRIQTLHVEDKDRDTLAGVMIQHWGENKCIIYTRDILKKIPRNDKEITEIIKPFLEEIGEIW